MYSRILIGEDVLMYKLYSLYISTWNTSVLELGTNSDEYSKHSRQSVRTGCDDP